jgi:hypothetical protein
MKFKIEHSESNELQVYSKLRTINMYEGNSKSKVSYV